MGCDIHCWAEVLVDCDWKIVKDGEKLQEFINYRSYDLFSILADVRNGYGFAGIRTGSGFRSIAPPRGVPQDCSSEYYAQVQDWNGDGHSHSWLTLDEILSYDWLQSTTKTGVISLEQWQFWKKYRKPGQRAPESYASAVQGPGRKTYPEDSLTDTIPADCTHVQVSWESPYYRAASAFWKEDVPLLLSLQRNLGPLRLVFFFDN